LKFCREFDDVTSAGKLFHVRARVEYIICTLSNSVSNQTVLRQTN